MENIFHVGLVNVTSKSVEQSLDKITDKYEELEMKMITDSEQGLNSH